MPYNQKHLDRTITSSFASISSSSITPPPPPPPPLFLQNMLEETSTKIYAHDARSGDSFGTSVSLYDNTALIGASWDDEYTSTDSGSVYIFSRAPSTVNAFVTVWTEETKLRASDATEHAAFGHSVSLYGDTALIGARYDNAKALDAGSVYVFQRSYDISSNSVSWTERARNCSPQTSKKVTSLAYRYRYTPIPRWLVL